MIKCPYCGKSHYITKYSTSTCMYFAPEFIDGVQVSHDRNIITVHCECCECGGLFNYDQNEKVNEEMAPKSQSIETVALEVNHYYVAPGEKDYILFPLEGEKHE